MTFAPLRRRRAAVFALALAAAAPCPAQDASRAAPPAQPKAAAELLRFDVYEYVIQGNTVLPAEVIERAVYRFMGEQRTEDDIQAARAALEQVYRAAGYGTVSVEVPPQRVVNGVVELQVLEGRVSRLRITGAQFHSQATISERVPAAEEGSVPHFGDLQAQLATVNRSEDRRVTPLLRPGKLANTTELDLVVEDQLPLHGTVELNNRSGPNTSSTRVDMGLRYNNLFQRDHSIGLQAQVSPQDTREVKLLVASYTVPIAGWAVPAAADSLSLSITRSDSAVAAGVGSTQVLGRGSIYGVRQNITLGLQEKAFHLLTLGVDYKDFEETVEIDENNGFSTPIHYLPLSASYLGVLEDPAGRWQLGATVSLALRNVASSEAQFKNKRFGASSGYSLLRLDLTREQKLPWLNSVLQMRVDAQFADAPLVSNEQFVLGGASSVRGYREAVKAGDYGWRASLEWRTAELAPQLGQKWLKALTAHAFLEGAVGRLRQPLPGQRPARLLSTGFGLRAKASPVGTLSLDLAFPLVQLPDTKRTDVRLHAAMGVEF